MKGKRKFVAGSSLPEHAYIPLTNCFMLQTANCELPAQPGSISPFNKQYHLRRPCALKLVSCVFRLVPCTCFCRLADINNLTPTFTCNHIFPIRGKFSSCYFFYRKVVMPGTIEEKHTYSCMNAGRQECISP